MAEPSVLLAALAKESLLQLVPGLDRVALERGVIRSFAAGQPIVRAGAPITDLVIPLAAALTLVDGAGSARVGRLERRRALALGALLEGRPYPYGAVAEQAVSVLFVPKGVVLDHLASVPAHLHYLRLVTQSPAVRSLRNLFRDRGLTDDALVHVTAAIDAEPRRLAPGDAFPTEPGLALVARGLLRVEGAGLEPARRLGAGVILGGETLVSARGRTYRVEVLEPTEIHWAPAARLAPRLAPLDLVDVLFDEPWLERSRARARGPTGALTTLPGEPVPLDALHAHGLALDPTRLARAADDGGSIAASLANLGLLQGVEVGRDRIEGGLSLRDRLGLLALAEELEAFGLVVSGARVDAAALRDEPAPYATWLGPRLVVVVAAARGDAVALDPGRGLVRLPLDTLASLGDGTILRAEPTPTALTRDTPGGDAPMPRGRGAAERAPPPPTIPALARRERPLLVRLVGLVVLGFALKLVAPLFLLHVFDAVLTLGRFDLAEGLVWGIALTIVLSTLTTLAQHGLFAELAVRLDAALSTHFYRQALALPAAFYQRRRVGDVITRLLEIERIREALSGASVGAALNVTAIVVNASILLAFSPPLGLAALGMVAALVALQLATRPGIQRLHRATFDGQRRSTSLVTELVASIVAVKAAAAEGALGRRWERSFLSSVESSRALHLRVNAVQLAINVVTAAGTTGVLYLAARAALAGELSVGAILAVSMYLQNLVRPTIGLSGLLSTLEEARVAAQKVEEVFAATPEEPPEVARVTHGARIRGKIRLDRVSFRYGADDPLVLKELSLTIYPGQVVAIVGRSGSGKSTLANLLAGHARPTGGRVFYDHYDASMLSRASLRRQIAYVQQGYALFAGTIASNVAFTTDVPDDAQIARAARDAHCQEFVERLPQRFEHTLAPRGLGLSGGQRQRLAIARALHQQPVILVLDEATSALDADAEAAVNENMARMTEGRTTLIVAHRVSTVRRADRILVVHDGEIVEDGDHRTLIARGGPYAELFEGQIDAEDEPSTRAG